VGHDPSVVELMPLYVKLQFGIAKVGRKYVTERAVLMVREIMVPAGKLVAALETLQALHKRTWLVKMTQYYSLNGLIDSSFRR
jgi:hypothetical protein